MLMKNNLISEKSDERADDSPNGNVRCWWAGDDPLYIAYHDNEWGRPVSDDRTLFEFLTLESAQAGLAWITILRKREGYRQAFCDFDFRKVARFSETDMEQILASADIVRNRLKVKAAVSNARLFSDIVDEFGSFYNYVVQFLPGGKRILNRNLARESVAVTSDVSDAMSADMKRRGFKFFGSVICYAFLQATGFIDDHLDNCPCKGCGDIE